ncbi:MAG: hydroxyacylglutathione hydrolase [Deltaproteobacteria bacterium]|nr:hydroxyacylglutathione hydrolase [Deltaproteobacteria bacterium]
MAHAVTTPPAPIRSAASGLLVYGVPTGEDNLTWVIATAQGEAAIVDGPDAGAALALIEREGLELREVWNTHVHGDHVGVNRDLARRGLLAGLCVRGPAGAADRVPGLSEAVAEGSRFELGGATVEVLHTPGHVDEHVVFVVGDLLFSGDTLFTAGSGYLFSGPPATMHRSLSRLSLLDPATRVLCAHEYTQDNLRFAWSVEPGNGALAARIRDTWARRGRGETVVPSTLADELETNPFLRTGSPEIVEAVLGRAEDAARPPAAEIYAAIRALKDSRAYRARGDSGLPLDPPVPAEAEPGVPGVSPQRS